MTTGPFGSIADDSLVSETAIENGDPVFTNDQLEKMSSTMLRRLAAHSDTECINGKSPRYIITCYFSCQRSLTEYSD